MFLPYEYPSTSKRSFKHPLESGKMYIFKI